MQCSVAIVAEQWRAVIVLDDARADKSSAMWRCKRDLAREVTDRTSGAAIVVGVPSSRLKAWTLAWAASTRVAGKSPVCAYTSNRAAAEAAAQAARDVAGQHGTSARVSIEYWRPVKRKWEDASAISESDLSEDRHFQQREDRHLSMEGAPQWWVRVELRTHRHAVALAQRLSDDGHHVDQSLKTGWKTVLASAETEDDARRLAEKAKQYAPDDAAVFAERSGTQDLQASTVPTWW